MEDLNKYISKEDYDFFCKQIKRNETIKIYEDGNIDIEMKKIKSKVYTYINIYTKEKTLNDALNDVCSLV